MSRIIVLFFWILFSIVHTGCASGPRFTATTEPKPDKALIYVYRKSSMVGAAGFDKLYINEDFITTMRSGGYTVYEAPPDTTVFYLTPRIANIFVGRALLINTQKKKYERLTINLEPGKTYYIKLYYSVEGHMLKMVDAQTGIKEIADLHLLKAGE